MQFSVTFRHMEPTESLKTYAQQRMERIRKYLPDPISCHVVLSTERHNHRIDVNFHLHNGLSIAGHEITENMYSSIDLVIAKIERQVRKYKGKLTSAKTRHQSVEPLPWSHTVVTEEIDESAAVPEPMGTGAATGPVGSITQEMPTPNPPATVVRKTEKFHASPLSVDEALMQLNLLDVQFLVFRSTTNGGVSVVYKREDGSYGLIETPAAQA
jgi:ribosome hibernation promoting factor